MLAPKGVNEHKFTIDVYMFCLVVFRHGCRIFWTCLDSQNHLCLYLETPRYSNGSIRNTKAFLQNIILGNLKHLKIVCLKNGTDPGRTIANIHLAFLKISNMGSNSFNKNMSWKFLNILNMRSINFAKYEIKSW